MGRKKSYERDQLVTKAIGLFRRHGYARTTTEMLVQEFGVNRNSMYAEFGDKKALFDVALKRYENQAMAANFGRLEAPGAGLAEVHSLLEGFAQATNSDAYGLGCLICNTVVELGPERACGDEFPDRYFLRIGASLKNALGNAGRTGDLRARTDIDAEAGLLTSVVIGLFVMLRAQADPDVIRESVLGARRHLDRIAVAQAGTASRRKD